MNLKPRRLLQSALMAFACIFFPFFSFSAVIYVNPSAAGLNNGTSWANAYTSLSSALLGAAAGDEIWVKQGVYKPVSIVDVNASGGTDAREATFQVPNGVAVYGGFSGLEAIRTERNFSTNPTILSGDIDNNDVNADANSIAENTGNIVGNNAYHVLYTQNVNSSTIVDGFIITAGYASFAGPVTDANQDGGAWYNRLSAPSNSSSPGIVNNTFRGNYAASEGGAIFMTAGSAGANSLSLIRNCKFISNKSNVAGGAINIGSFTAGNYQPHITNCEFSTNEAFRRGGAIYFVGDHATIDSTLFRGNKVTAVSPDGSTLPGSGGAVNMTGSNAVFNKCFFDANTTTGNPTGPFEGGGGGAVYMSTNQIQTQTLGISAPKFISCGFYSNVATGNTAAWGGAAVHLNDAGKLTPTYVNCVFSANQAQNDGGAIANFTRVISADAGFVPVLTPRITNCTFVANLAGARGGAMFNDGYVWDGVEVLQSRIENSILWNNTAGISGPQIFLMGITNTVAYSLVQGSGGSGGGWDTSVGTDGSNNIDVNPNFVNAAAPLGVDNIPATADDGLRLPPISPAVDKGNNGAAGLAAISTDYIAAARIQGSRVDMGAYEQAGILIPPVKIYWLKDWNPVKPFCLSCPWAFKFSENIFEEFIWDGPAQLILKDKSAVITGHIVSRTNKKTGFDVYLKLIDQQDWKTWSSNGGTYAAYTLEAIQVAKAKHQEWTFWELSKESYLNGTGDVSGQVDLKTLPGKVTTGFQLGEGANGWDKDLGLSGTFRYQGKLNYKGKKLNAKGIGSINVDADPCEKGCVPLIELSSKVTEAAHLNMENAETLSPGFSVFPVPAQRQLNVSLNSMPAGKYTLKIFDAAGQLKKQETVYANKTNLQVSVAGLSAGTYILQLNSSTGVTQSKKLVIK